MATKTKRAAAPKTVSIYNHTTHTIGVHLPGGKKDHPPRLVNLLPGNNDNVSAEDWEAMQNNATFMVNFSPQKQNDRVGKKIRRTNLELGKSDKHQGEDEAELKERVDQARKERAAELGAA